MTLVAGMAAGAGCIDDMVLLRRGGMGRAFDGCYAPSTLGSFLRASVFGYSGVRGLKAIAATVTTKDAAPVIAATRLRSTSSTPDQRGHCQQPLRWANWDGRAGQSWGSFLTPWACVCRLMNTVGGQQVLAGGLGGMVGGGWCLRPPSIRHHRLSPFTRRKSSARATGGWLPAETSANHVAAL